MAPCKSIVTFCLAFGVSFGARAQGAQEFYKNKQIRMIIGHPVGNDYDLAGRFLARYLGKHIPGEPTIIVQNMPAAASIAAANFLYAQAPRDGTVFGSFSRNVPSQALMGQMNVEADPRRFNWLGATSLPARVCVRWVTAPVKTPADLFTQEFIVGGAGAGSSLSILPTVFNHVLGTRFRIIQGYKGTTDTVLAMERGEVQGACASYGQFRICARRKRRSPKFPTCRPSSTTQKPANSVSSCNSSFRARSSDGRTFCRPMYRKIASRPCARRLQKRCKIRRSSPRRPG
jgi:tripartite-type tricarboxylate transporter receptor subunit TctC